MASFILALDQGTTSSRAIIYNDKAQPIFSAQQEFEQIFPQPGWVEHNAEEIWHSQQAVMLKVISNIDNPDDMAGIGITNQRETTVVWDRQTGKPIYNAIVWQDRRTSAYCDELKAAGHGQAITDKTGLLLDAYFSATKIKWILDNVDDARQKANAGELAFGTIDSWLIWNLTNGEKHITDVTNASRTMLFNIHSLQWDDDLLSLFKIPRSMLPEVKSSSEHYGDAQIEGNLTIPITGIAGDQQAALFGQMCIENEMAKCTYGTGCFLVMNTGNKPVVSNNKLLTTIGWQIGDEVTYALEGSVFMGGAIIQWLRDGLEIFDHAAESEEHATSVDDNGGVVFVPALTGLGAPHWDSSARGSIFGITRGTTKGHVARAALESIAFQVDDLLETMAKDMGKPVNELRVDGGATANNLLMQLQANISDLPVIRPTNLETTALGAAYLAGLAVNLWDMDTLKTQWGEDKKFSSEIDKATQDSQRRIWQKAISRTKNWLD
ncbi:MAG: glycerol kinase [Bacteroidetes bacterium]|nr:MAG: glycerol kinase [Bacteroidota bacterium]